MNKLSINIPSPCTEDWHQMTDCGLGKYCGSCRKTVVDFTGYTDSEIVRYVNNHKGELCGRFTTDQLNRTLIEPSAPISGNWFFRFISGLLMLGGAKEALAEAPEVKLEMVADSSSYKIEIIECCKLSNNSMFLKVQGRVVNSLTGKGVKGVGINNESCTNELGFFEIVTYLDSTEKLPKLEITTQYIEAEKGIEKTDIDSVRSVTINGRVIDKETKEPLSGAVINELIETNDSGSFEITLPIIKSEANQRLFVRWGEYSQWSEVIDLKSKSEIIIEFYKNEIELTGIVVITKRKSGWFKKKSK